VCSSDLYALAPREPEQAVAELCTCLSFQPDLERCREVVVALLDPRGSQYMRLRSALFEAERTCPSAHGRAALAASIRRAREHHLGKSP
jgi:hypothetical protein